MSSNYLIGSHLGIDIGSVTVGEGTGALTLVSATSLSAGVVRVVFSEDILDSVLGHQGFPIPVFDPYNYVITRQTTGAVLRVLRVKQVSDTTYDLYTNEQDDVWYDISIYNIYDVYGNKIDPENNSDSFYGTTQPYLELANEMRVFPAGYFGMDSFEVTDFIPDQGQPLLQNQNPAPGAVGIIQTTPIYLEIIDLDKGVDPTTVTLTVDGEYALLGGVEQPGYDVTQTVIISGYAYTIQPAMQFFEGSVVEIGVSAKDLAYLPMELNASYSFSTTGTPPYLQNQSPTPGETDINPYKTVIFELVDPNSGIDISSVIIRVNGINAVINDVGQNGHTFTRTAVSGGWRYQVRRPEPFLVGIEGSVTVIANNGAEVPLSISETYNFFVSEIIFHAATSYKSHIFNVPQIDIVAIPQPKTVWNQFDEHGLTLSLGRLTGEKNWQYKRRLMDTLVHAANASYQGMVHGVTRELGLSLFRPIEINPKVDANGNFLAPDPYIRFEGPYIYLYSDYKNGLLDWAIDRYESGGNYEHLGRLVDFINTTAFFEAHFVGPFTLISHAADYGILDYAEYIYGVDAVYDYLSDIDPYTRSMTIVNQSNRIRVKGESIKASTKFKLENEYLIRGTVSFNDKLTFRTEMSSAAQVTETGQYHIDYRTGTVTVASVPDSNIAIRYEYTEYPFRPIASPVIIHDVTSENFRAKMFRQVLQDDGTYIHGMPTEVGVDIINELMSIFPLYWGV